MPSSLLHYTSLDVVQILLSDAIKEKRATLKFHASHLEMMNDLREGALILNRIFTSALKKRTLEEQWKEYKKIHTPFVISLIRSNNTTPGRGEIPMWKMYGANGAGAFLRFNYKELRNRFSKQSLCLGACNYLSATHLSGESKGLNSLLDNNQVSENEKFDKLLNISSFAKSLEWKYENEWRILIQRHQDTVLTKSTSRGIVEYTEVELPLSALEEICLGPLTDANSLTSVGYLCDKLQEITGKEIKVGKSKIAMKL